MDENNERITLHMGADVAEIPYVFPLAKQLHEESYFRDFPFSYKKYENMCLSIRDRPDYYSGLYVELDGEPVAFAYFGMTDFMADSETKVTTIHTIYIRKDVRSTPICAEIWNRMLGVIRLWSTPRMCKSIFFHVTSGLDIEATDSLLRLSNATYLGGNYVMRL